MHYIIIIIKIQKIFEPEADPIRDEVTDFLNLFSSSCRIMVFGSTEQQTEESARVYSCV
jgi:hypothetical protein